MTDLEALQARIRERYAARDRARGEVGTFLWLVEEMGEVSMALRGKEGDLGEELADVIAWALSLANLRGIDLEDAFATKYPPRACVRCNANPCECGS